MRSIKITTAYMLVLALLLLAGCTPLPLVPGTDGGDVALPTPSEPAVEAPIGDGRTSHSERVTLYYPSLDQQTLVPVTGMLAVDGDKNLSEIALQRLLMEPGHADVLSLAPVSTRILSFEQVGGIVTASLNSVALNMDAQQRVSLRAAAAETLGRLPGVTHVNLLINGQAEDVLGVPLGLATPAGTNLGAAWNQAQADAQRITAQGADRHLDVDVALYFAARDGSRLLAEPRRVRLNNDGDYILPLLRELVRGPVQVSEAAQVLPDGMEPLQSAPTITTSSDGLKLITLPLTPGFDVEMRKRGMSLRQMCGALTLTLLRFVPEVDGVVIRIGGERLERISDQSGEMLFENGVMTQQHFGNMLGETAHIYLGTEAGKLRRVGRVLDPYSATQPRALMEMLLAGPGAGEEGLVPVFPEGLTSADILGLRIENGTALVNLSSNFYRCCQSLGGKQERLLVYAMVNTLTLLSDVNRVRFFVDGQVVDVLAHEIYLRGELIENPGIIED